MFTKFKSALGAILSRALGQRGAPESAGPVRHVSRKEIVDDLRSLGIASGDTVFVHSSLRSLGYVIGGPRTLLDALLEAVGPEGTLIVPTYYMPGGSMVSACRTRGYVFDPRRHGSNVGAVPDAFLELEGVERSIHPTHSVSALGRHARYVTADHHKAPSAFGAGSPWDRFVELDGKLLGLGITMGPVTFYHLLEDRVLERFPLPVRMRRTWRLKCVDRDGRPWEVPVNPLDPVYAKRRIDHKSRDDLRDYFWREFSHAGLLKVGKVGDARAWTIGARDFYRHLEQLMNEGITIYSSPQELVRRPIAAVSRQAPTSESVP